MLNIPLYKLTISDNDDEPTGVKAVALVDMPAIEMNWLAFSKTKQVFQATNPEKRIVSGPLMVAGLPIYRADAQMMSEENPKGEYYVMFEPETIQQIVQKYFRQKNTGSVNMMHEKELIVPGVYMFESFIIDSAKGIYTPKGWSTLPDGSWFGSFKVDNQSLWDEFIKTGAFKGFSVEGYFNQELYQEITDQTISRLRDVINGTD